MSGMDPEVYRDKVYGCWLGKKAGGTLGAPLEGQRGPHRVSWYPELREGPNDDLELQLIWLEALERYGPALDSRILAERWLDCVFYNWDEYGMAKTNLRLGLPPPLSGAYNNWFKDCTGAPIRSEIWACVAPGRPELAARLAYEDAIVDHAGGEGAYGEIFLAALESEAFVAGDVERLINVGLKAIPEECRVAKAVRDTLRWYGESGSWEDVRARILEVHGRPNFTDAPQNIAFVVLGWLEGEGDFGRSICAAVNCGYDTDCTGATLGAILGIIYGRSGLPERWTEPLGDGIATNVDWGGVRNFSPPKDLSELTERTCEMGRRLSAFPAGEVKDLWSRSPWELTYEFPTLRVRVDYKGPPTVRFGVGRRLDFGLENLTPLPLEVEAELRAPEGWRVLPGRGRFVLPPGGRVGLTFEVWAEGPKSVLQSNRFYLELVPCGRPALGTVPVVLVGEGRWLVAGPFAAKGSDLDVKYGPELSDPLSPEGSWEGREGQEVRWVEVHFPENELPVEGFFDGRPGVVYLRHYLWTREERTLRIGLPSNAGVVVWANGERVIEAFDPNHRPRPNYGGYGRFYRDVRMRKGWNWITVKLVRGDRPVEAHFVLCNPGPFYDGVAEVLRTKFPWEVR